MPKGTHRKTPDARDCRQCHRTFKPKVAWQDFCGTPCRRAFWQAGGIDTRALWKSLDTKIREAVQEEIRSSCWTGDIDARVKNHEDSFHSG